MSCARAGRSMREQVFLCGLSKSQRRCYGAGKELNLQGAKANVRLNVENLRGKSATLSRSS